MKRSRIGLLILPALAVFAACDDATGPGDSLSQAEAEALASILLSQSVAASDASDPAAASGTVPRARQVTEVNQEISLTLPCPLGGSVATDVTFSGSSNPETQDASISYAIVQAHDACQVRAEESGITFTLTGAPNISSTYALDILQGSAFQLEGSISGSVEWSTADRAGTCVISLTFSGSGSEVNGFAMSVGGSVCSARIEQQVSVT